MTDISPTAFGESPLSPRALLAAIVDSSDDAIVSKSLTGQILSWNKGAERMFGYTKEEAVGQHITLIIPTELRSEEDHILARLRAGERIDHFETTRVRKDGKRLRISLTVSPVIDETGTIVGASKIARDITERVQLLEAERAARADAERSSRMKDEFLSTISHELRTPLTAILGWAQILRAGGDAIDNLEVGLETIERNARAQSQIIDDLLDMSRIMSGKVRLDVQRVELDRIIEAAIESIRPAATVKDIRIFAVLDPSAGLISGDPNRLQQIFWNLLSNAVKFTPKGGKIQVLLERVNSHVEVSVIDNGEGIDAAFLPQVFDRFRQQDSSTSRPHSGLGLGLSIVKQLVELHGGTVRAKSPGKNLGTTFMVSFPVIVVRERTKEVGRQETQFHASNLVVAISLKGVRILAVDDEPDARNLIKTLLQDKGATVDLAGSAEEAMEYLESNRPDVVISDIGMPAMDGFAFAKWLRTTARQEVKDVPAIALTAYARTEDRTHAILSGFQMHLSKPVEPVELLAMIASLARRT